MCHQSWEESGHAEVSATILHNWKDCADPRNDPKGRRMEEFSPKGGWIAGGCVDWKIIQQGTYLHTNMNCMQCIIYVLYNA